MLSEEKFSETIAFLEEVIALISSIKIGQSGVWKLFQTGILISTQSVINLLKYLFYNEKFEFIFTSRFMQDCVENLFSVIRSKHVIPNTLQFKNNLKLITVSQYMKSVAHSSYVQDRNFISDFLNIRKKNNKSYRNQRLASEQNIQQYLCLQICDINNMNLNNVTLNCLYYIAGYVISRVIRKTGNSCTACIPSLGSKTPIQSSYAYLT